MQDEIIKQTGNSRYMKSNIAANATWEQVRDLLRAGTFPFDFNGKNPAGIAQVGTDLSKANLFSDDVAKLFDLSGTSATVNAALAKATKIKTGTYAGTGTQGKNTPTSIPCPFTPILAIINELDSTNVRSESSKQLIISSDGYTISVRFGPQNVWNITASSNISIYATFVYATLATGSVSWYMPSAGKYVQFWCDRDGSAIAGVFSTTNGEYQLNKAETNYNYIIIGQ